MSNPRIDKLHLLEEGMSLGKLIRQLRKEQFTHVVDLHNNLRTRRIKWALGVSSSTFEKLNAQKWLLVNTKIDRLPNRHIVDRYMDTVKGLGVKMDNLGLEYFIPDRDRMEWAWLPETHQAGFVAFAIGGQHATKRLPLDRLIALCHQINKPVVLVGGKEDAQTGEEIARFFNAQSGSEQADLSALDKKTIIFNACGKCNLNQSAWLIQQASVVFTHDTGMMHIAAAFHKQIYSIWGNTTPKFGMYPYRTRFTIYENNNLRCRPCSKLGFNKCPKGHFKCMRDLKFDFYLSD